MRNRFINIWKDPVWSKVIAAFILGILSLIYNVIQAYYNDTNFIFQFKKMWLIKINLWLALLMVLVFFSLFNYLNKKKITKFVYDNETIELDKKLFNRIKNELLTAETLDNLYNHLFSTHTFEKEKFDFIYATIKANENPEFEFLNPDLEKSKEELINAIKKFRSSTIGTIYSAPTKNDFNFLGIPREWDEKKFYSAMDKIELEETNLFSKTEEFIKKGRRILKI